MIKRSLAKPSWMKSFQNCFAVLSIFLPSVSLAWDQHHFLMPIILSGTSPDLSQILNRSGKVPCKAEDEAFLKSLLHDLAFNESIQLPPTSQLPCDQAQATVYDQLTGGTLDDPDRGIDKDLPVSSDPRYDPNGDRKWMGGTTGSTSQGFRHMYFGGWKLSHPITTFQIPINAIGQAPTRFEIIARKAKELIRSGNLVWGARVLGWSMHYIQDLAQPFHSAQIIHFQIVPWNSLFEWPIQKGFEQLVKETTRVVTNYHWAYEGYVRDQIMMGKNSPYYSCLNQPEKYSKIKFDPKSEDPKPLAYSIASASIEIAPDVGAAEFAFFGTHLRDPGIDFTKNLDMINNAQMAIRPDLKEPRDQLNTVTCTALANAALGSRLLIQWAFQP